MVHYISVRKLLKYLPTGQIADLSGLSPSYVSQVKHGKCKPSQKLIDAILLSEHCPKPGHDYLKMFLESRRASGCAANTITYYESQMRRFAETVPNYAAATQRQIEQHLASIGPNRYGLGNRHARYLALRVFYRWLSNTYGMNDPMAHMKGPHMGKPIMPTLTREQIHYLLDSAESVRDKAIIATLAESGLRLAELVAIKASDIDWQARTIRTIGKGRKEAYAPFGELSAGYLREWLNSYNPDGQGIWGVGRKGIQDMLTKLGAKTGLTCNAHCFRRSFAVLMRQSGVDSLTIAQLGRWESVSMVQRYTRSFNFSDAMKFYKGTLGG